jgi:hypothetical protein
MGDHGEEPQVEVRCGLVVAHADPRPALARLAVENAGQGSGVGLVGGVHLERGSGSQPDLLPGLLATAAHGNEAAYVR